MEWWNIVLFKTKKIHSLEVILNPLAKLFNVNLIKIYDAAGVQRFLAGHELNMTFHYFALNNRKHLYDSPSWNKPVEAEYLLHPPPHFFSFLSNTGIRLNIFPTPALISINRLNNVNKQITYTYTRHPPTTGFHWFYKFSFESYLSLFLFSSLALTFYLSLLFSRSLSLPHNRISLILYILIWPPPFYFSPLSLAFTFLPRLFPPSLSLSPSHQKFIDFTRVHFRTPSLYFVSFSLAFTSLSLSSFLSLSLSLSHQNFILSIFICAPSLLFL